MKPGIYTDLSNEDYHSSEGISRSGIMEFNKSPLHYYHNYIDENTIKKEPSPAMIIGNAIHEYILEPKKFEKTYFLVAKMDKRTIAGKEYYKSIEKISENKIKIDHEMLNEIQNISNSVLNNEYAKSLIDGAVYENSIYWIDSDTGVLCKARPDIMTRSYIGDLKTTEDASERAFTYSIYNYNYHVQAAMLIDGYNEIQKLLGSFETHENFIMIPVEKKAPYASRVVLMSEEKIQQGREIYKAALVEYKKCLEDNHWPTYPTITI